MLTEVITIPDFSWYSPRFAALYYGRTERHIRRMCNNGTFIDFGLSVYQDARQRWWIKLPPDALTSIPDHTV